MPVPIKIAVLWLLWAFCSSAAFVVQLVDPKNRLYGPWVAALLTATATVFILI